MAESWNAAGIPRLNARPLPYSHNVHLSWSLENSLEISLWSAPELATSGGWEPVKEPAVNDGRRLCLALPASQPARFFALRRTESTHGSSIRPAFMFRVATPAQEKEAGLLLDSIRDFGGPFRSAPFYAVLVNPAQASGSTLTNRGARLVESDMDTKHRSFPFADKVYACAQIETLVEKEADWLVYFDTEAVVLNPPLSLFGPSGAGVLIRPVHYQNVGVLTNRPLDPFWQTIYAEAGATTNLSCPVQSFVDGQHLRPYFNCAFMVCRPQRGLLRAWRECFARLLNNPALRSKVAFDGPHQTYLHQATLSAVIIAGLAPEEIHILPPTYGYPMSVQSSIPSSRRLTDLNQLQVGLYQGSLGACLNGFTAGPEHQAWLIDQGIRR